MSCSPRTSCGPRGARARCAPAATSCGLGPRRVRRIDAARLRRPRPALGRAATTGRCASGTEAAGPPPGARRRGGRWACSSPPTGRRAGSSRRSTEDVTKTGPVPMLRREFKLSGRVARARAYATSHGLYELHLNGQRVGDQLFTPGWTSYNKRLQYQTYDVTALLKPGANAVGALARQRLVPRRPDGLRRAGATSTATGSALLAPDRGDLRGRAPRDRGQRRELESPRPARS